MVAGEPVLAEIDENAATAKEFATADEVLSAMVVYGFLSHLAARDSYHIQKEQQGGRGYWDFLFLPKRDKSEDCIILEFLE